MSFDLMTFNKSKAPNRYEEFLTWTNEQTKWSEERNYDSIDGTSECLVAWFMEMKETFPPMNGPFSPSDEKIDADSSIENRLADYSIGTDVVYAAFGYSSAEEAERLALQYARKHDVGFFNPQTGEVYSDGMIVCKMTTESKNDKAVIWEQIERELLTLDNPQRGTTNREGAFVTLMFENNGTNQDFMQCMPIYPKQSSFLGKLFGAKQPQQSDILTYTVEASNGQKLYEKQVSTKEQAVAILREYYVGGKLPDLSDWADTGIL